MIRKHFLHRNGFACLWIAVLMLPAFFHAVLAESVPDAGAGPAAVTVPDAVAESVAKQESGAAEAAGSDSEPAAETSEEDASGIDFVLVLDGSGTMAQSDPKGLTAEAAKMFVDMLPNKNARVAVVEFGPNYGENAFNAEKYTK